MSAKQFDKDGNPCCVECGSTDIGLTEVREIYTKFSHTRSDGPMFFFKIMDENTTDRRAYCHDCEAEWPVPENIEIDLI